MEASICGPHKWDQYTSKELVQRDTVYPYLYRVLAGFYGDIL